MTNESKTENIVRNELRVLGYYDNNNIIIEEKSSDNPKIDSILQNASKRGSSKKGYPEFIISFKDKPDTVIVVECKADLLKHESKDRKQYADYAVDGALLYASHLKEQYNVTAIAVSGETDKERRISHFLWLKNHITYKDISNKKILSPESINQIIQEQSEPLKEEELIKKAIEYNNKLNSYSIPETERCTIISCILVALQDKGFLECYNSFFEYVDNENYNPNEELINALLDACSRVLKRNNISNDKNDVIIDKYKEIKNTQDFLNKFITNPKTKKEEPNTILRDLISDFNEHVMPHISNGIFDILGKFYTQFIRYAGSDSKTGLVLTPSHIADFFCDIADINENDIVYDPCCGTGGFLVSTMKHMIAKTHDLNKINEIKKSHLIGVEKRTDMFTHACSNMMMRGDGKSSIFLGNCFDSKIKEKVKEHKPTKAFLNPPYDVKESGQLEFLEHSLECLEKNGIAVAICQMSVSTSSKKEVLEVKRRLLEKHTLLAVFSLPDNLFSPRNQVVSCILVIKAHSPHSIARKTFFGYFKDDGYMVSKNQGRHDTGKWENIKNLWLNTFINMESIAGLSICKAVKHTDEWCAEAYMETDYSNIPARDFGSVIKNLLAYELISGHVSEITQKSKNTQSISFNTSKWKTFIYEDIFEIKRGSSLYIKNCLSGEFSYISASASNNGSTCSIDTFNREGNCISLSYDGSIGEAFYQRNPFFCSEKVVSINIAESLGQKINPYIACFLITIIRLEKFRYNYGLKWAVESRMKKSKIKLPVTKDGNPDWQFMEDYIKSLPYSASL